MGLMMLRWKVFKTTKNAIRARNNLMNFRVWCLAFEQVSKKNKDNDYVKGIEDRLTKLEADEVYNIERRR